MSHSEEINYYNDSRVRAWRTDKWWNSINEKNMTATVTVYEEDCEEDVEVPISYEVCPTCDGKGSHVNPSIDCNGLTAEDFYEDPDLAEDYFNGTYDVACYECNGNRVVPVCEDKEVLKKIHEYENDIYEMEMERLSEMRMGA